MSIRLFSTKAIAILLFIGITISLSILGVRVWLTEDRFVTVEIIASGGDWWQTLPKTPYWLADQVKPSDIETTLGGKKLAEILETKKYEDGISKILWARIKLLVTKDIAREGWKFQQQPLAIGSTISIQPNGIKLTGNVIAIDQDPSSKFLYQNSIVTVKLYFKRKWFSDTIRIGDKYIDDSGNIYTEIIDKSVVVAETSMPTKDGKIVLATDPLYRDITLKIKLQTVQLNGQKYFNRIQPVKIGNKLWLSLPNYNIDEAEIIEINDTF